MDKSLVVGPLAMNKTNLKRDALAGEVAVVTGGAGNVGLGTARSLLSESCNQLVPQHPLVYTSQ
jgi:hypothetical protein